MFLVKTLTHTNLPLGIQNYKVFMLIILLRILNFFTQDRQEA